MGKTRMTPKILLTSILVLNLLSCTPVLKIELASSTETVPNPRFTITEINEPAACRSANKNPQIDTVQLLLEDDTVLWRIRATGINNVGEITYGVTPPGFFVEVEPAELTAGPTYILEVRGNGADRFKFIVGTDGVIIPYPWGS